MTIDPRTTALRESLALLAGRPSGVAAGVPYVRCGQDPRGAETLVLVHGLGSSRETWAAVLAPLAERYDVIAVDLPGHGQSPAMPRAPRTRLRAPSVIGPTQPAALAEVLAEALTELGLTRAHLVGNSLGGWVVLECAADGHAASVTALAPAGLRTRLGPIHPMLRVNRFMAKATAPVSDTILTLRPLRAMAFATGSVSPGRLDLHLARSAARAMALSTGYEPMLAAAAAGHFTRADEVQVPVCVAFGDRDAILPAPGNQHRELLPEQTRWEIWEHCGHAPMWDQPERTVALIDAAVAATQHAKDQNATPGLEPLSE